MTNKVLISIIIPSHGRAKRIITTIQSIPLDNRIEIIVVDDNGEGTTNQLHTEKIVNAITRNNLIYVKLKSNSGASVARNVGVENSQGKLIGFLDDDDLIIKDNFLQKLSYFEENSNRFDILCSHMEIHHEGKVPHQNIRPKSKFVGQEPLDFLLRGVCYTPMIMIKRSSFFKVEGFPVVGFFQDHNFILKAHMKGMLIEVFDSPTFIHVTHSDGRISSVERKNLDGLYTRIDLENTLMKCVELSSKEEKRVKYNQVRMISKFKINSKSTYYEKIVVLFRLCFRNVFSLNSLLMFIKDLVSIVLRK